MEEKNFIWPMDLTKRLIELRFKNDWLFKEKKRPWAEFYKILLDNGFPEEMTINHVRKKWSYTYDSYRIAKKTKNKSWKYYKMFDKHYGKSQVLDKFDSWNDEWRLKLITCVTEAKEVKLDFHNMWRTVENALRCQDLPLNCCIQDIKGLWHYIRMTFNRKHRYVLRGSKGVNKWPLYTKMYDYYKKYEPESLARLETMEPLTSKKTKQVPKGKSSQEDCGSEFVSRDVDGHPSRCSSSVDIPSNLNPLAQRATVKYGGESPLMFPPSHRSKHITESFIQIRLQNDWLFRDRTCAWNDLRAVMVEEYGFPKTLTGQEIRRKWAATYGEYQKAKATDNKTWLYYTLFELYFGEGRLSLNPLVGWQEEWVSSLINARTELEHLFRFQKKKSIDPWREVEKRLRTIGIPIDHSLLDLIEIWKHLLRTFKWKQKFANKGILNEQWPYYEALSRYTEINQKQIVIKQKVENDDDNGFEDDNEDNIKLFDLKQKLSLVKPKVEIIENNTCRSCSSEEGSVNIYNLIDEQGLNLAYKLKIICGVEADQMDGLPDEICMNCIRELENAFIFRQKCQKTDNVLRNNSNKIKIESSLSDSNHHQLQIRNDENQGFEVDIHFEELGEEQVAKPKVNPVSKAVVIKKEKKIIRKKKVCEVCGKHTRDLLTHLDTHANDKLHSCDICQKKFKYKSGVITHKAIHSPPKKTCEVCGKKFHQMVQYRRHFAYHANERKFECETCGKRFNSSDILRVHCRTHTDERPFPCPNCGKTFRTAGCVSRHKRIVHNNVKIAKK